MAAKVTIKGLRDLERRFAKLATTAELLKGGKLQGALKVEAVFSRNELKELLKIFKEFPGIADRAVNYAMKSMAPELKQALDDAMDSPVWKWQTTASNDFRDIVDTGELKRSGRVFYRDKGLQIRYGAVYAVIVHYGGYVGSGYVPGLKIYYPPRPWIDAVVNGTGPVDRYPFETNFLKYFYQYVYDKKPILRP